MAVFLKIPGINGGATEKKHEGWVKVDSLQFGVGRSISAQVGSVSSREAGMPNVSEVHVTKPMDAASIELFGWSVSKYDAKKVVVDVVSTGRDDPFTTYTLDNAVISGYSVSAAGDQMPTEAISFNFSKIEERFVPIGADMKPGSPVNKGYDLATARQTS
jgi:type VI secretion system secreted protein Hcp